MPVIAKFRPLKDLDEIKSLRRRGAKRPEEYIDRFRLGMLSEAMTSGEPV